MCISLDDSRGKELIVYLQVGYELLYECPQPTPMILMLNIHSTRAGDVVVPDRLITNPCIPVTSYYDGFGNWCSRIVAPKGQLWLSTSGLGRFRSDGQHRGYCRPP